MKGSMAWEKVVRIILILFALMIVTGTFLHIAGGVRANIQGCGAIRQLISDLSAGAIQLC